MNTEQLMQEALDMEAYLVESRRYLHAHPGVGFDLGDTVTFVKKELESMGYTPCEYGKSGIVVLAGGKKPGKTFLIRGDMDALPMAEETDLPFASENGSMHACGHDFHTSMLLGAAKLLKAHEDEIEGTVKIMFQPAEEIMSGALDMMDAGLLENPAVDAAMMFHVGSGIPLPPGVFITMNDGVAAPAADFFEIKIQGKGCHGSMPNAGVDPITVAAHVIMGLQEIHARELKIADEVVITMGTIQAGNVPNVIPDTASLTGTIRTYDETVRAFVKERMQEITTSIGNAYRADARVVFGQGCPNFKNDGQLAKDATSYLREVLAPQSVVTQGELLEMMHADKSARLGGGSEDFAYISHKIPSIIVTLTAGHPKDGYLYPQHHPKVNFDECVLPKGSVSYAYAAMRWLEEHK